MPVLQMEKLGIREIQWRGHRYTAKTTNAVERVWGRNTGLLLAHLY
jgi:hypothetical protein